MKEFVVVLSLVLCSTNAFACGPLPFCAEGKYLQDACKKPLELDSYLTIKEVHLMARACQSIGMPLKVVPCKSSSDPACPTNDELGGRPTGNYNPHR
jgi:hypothetical protein